MAPHAPQFRGSDEVSTQRPLQTVAPRKHPGGESGTSTSTSPPSGGGPLSRIRVVVPDEPPTPLLALPLLETPLEPLWAPLSPAPLPPSDGFSSSIRLRPQPPTSANSTNNSQ